jgi:ATP-dependent RNA helicase DDX51/DBP6
LNKGSGKTLTYVLPIIQSLKNRIQPCCRALILLPVSDLAEQVYNIFKANLNDDNENLNLIETNKSSKDLLNNNNEHTSGYKNNNNNLKVMLLSTKNLFAKEQAQLVNDTHNKCLIDIIVTTPGRLVDHIQKTKGFHLNELRYLVLDECDRIMDQIKQNWLSILNKAVFDHTNLNNKLHRELLDQESLNVYNLFFNKKKLLPYQKLLLSATLTRNPEKLEQVNLFKPIYFNVAAEKLNNKQSAASAVNEKINDTNGSTLANKKPEEVEAISTIDKSNNILNKSKGINQNLDNSEDINLPNELNELMIEVVASQKPLIAIYLIKTLGYRRMLCFVKSIDTAKRLNKLFELNNIVSMEYSSSLHVARRKRVQEKFEQDKIDVLVCSDVMARGMDLENVDYVLLYDSVKFLNSYIHKVGRTARAGRVGTAISFLEHKEIFFFKKMMAQINTQQKPSNNKSIKQSDDQTSNLQQAKKSQHKVREFKIQKSKLKPLLENYRNSLLKLKEDLHGANKKEVANGDDKEIENKNETENKNSKRKQTNSRNFRAVKKNKY